MLNHGTSNKLLYIHNEVKCSYEKKTKKDKIPMDWHGSWLGNVGGIGQSIKTKFFTFCGRKKEK